MSLIVLVLTITKILALCLIVIFALLLYKEIKYMQDNREAIDFLKEYGPQIKDILDKKRQRRSKKK